MIFGFLIFGCLVIEGLEAPDKENSEKTGSIADFSEKEFAYLKRVNQIAGNIKAVLDMEKAYADIDLEKLDEDLDIDAEGLMEELSELLMKELTGLDLDSASLDSETLDTTQSNDEEESADPSTVELPFEQCSGDACASVNEKTDSKDSENDKNVSDDQTDNNIIEADSSEEVARAIAASVLRKYKMEQISAQLISDSAASFYELHKVFHIYAESHKILKLAEKMKWEEAIIDGNSKVQNYLLNAILVIEKKNSLSENGLNELQNCWSEKDCRCLLLKLSLCAGEEAAGAKPESANRMAQQAVCH